MISSCWRAASSVFLASSSEILAICTLASPLTKKRQSQEPERMVSLWFVKKKKTSLLQDRGEEWRGHVKMAWRESPHLPIWARSVERRNRPTSCGSQALCGSSSHCPEPPPQGKSGRLWQAARRCRTKQKAPLANSARSTQEHTPISNRHPCCTLF